ncbi:MAG: hypothetical protein A2X94_15090 [Bdellovibrionales bacterium GWB1_55_8]|nr:MAG: hypothetical protein A2X94_15090 [Bdellovibrionales bacterium GWB1_55_8]
MIRKILGESKAVKDLLKMISRVAASKTNLLVIGESGTGKELVARMIHDSGPLKDKPFVPVNCGAIPETLIESEMFGHRRGSFTGAVNEKMGLFETANGGTLFLDEVGELPLGIQVKLLRAIQERVFRKVGGNDDIHVDLRIIAATNRDLEAAVAAGKFREDLYYRLNVILIKTPALRERDGDVELLANHFLRRFGDRFAKKFDEMPPEVIRALNCYEWPGNVRELENVMERAVTLASGQTISIDSFPAMIQNALTRAEPMFQASASAGPDSKLEELRIALPNFGEGPVNLDLILADIEKTYLLRALSYSGGVKRKAAELLGITFRSIRYRLAKLGVETGDADD